jgi:hypothetical protein
MTPAAKEGLPAVVGELVAEMRELARKMDEGDISFGGTSDELLEIADRLSALTAEAGKGEEYVDPADVFLSQGTDDVPCLQIPGRVLARFIPGSWNLAYDLFSGNTPLSTATPAGEWREIESAPVAIDPMLTDVETCLVYGPKIGRQMGRAWRYADGIAQAQAYGFHGFDSEITHWRPLPAPPLAASPRGASAGEG